MPKSSEAKTGAAEAGAPTVEKEVEKKKKGEKENEREGRKSASAPQDERGRKNAQFFWEVAVFLLGIFIGFFWSQYAQHTQSQEGHLVVALLIVVLILIRYISLFIGR